MGDFIQNPRRFPRVNARYRVVVTHGGAGWSAETFDVSATGCQIVTPRAIPVGEVARLVIESPQVSQPLAVFGSVAWVAGQGRVRAGIAYAARQPDGDPTSWFKRLVAAQPGIEGTLRRVPERLPVDTRLFLRPPPQFIFDFGQDEVALLRLLGDGMTIATILQRGPFPAAQAAKIIFALLEQRIITLSLGEAAPAWRWKAALADFETRPADRVPPPPPAPLQPPPPLRVAPPPVAVPSPPPRAAPTTAAQPPPSPAPQASPASQAPPQAAATTPAPTPTPEPRPAARAPVAGRPADAQECFDLAVSAVSMGEISTAIGLLRRALQLSPRDPEISALLGQLAFRDRQAPTR